MGPKNFKGVGTGNTNQQGTLSWDTQKWIKGKTFKALGESTVHLWEQRQKWQVVFCINEIYK